MSLASTERAESEFKGRMYTCILDALSGNSDSQVKLAEMEMLVEVEGSATTRGLVRRAIAGSNTHPELYGRL